MVIVLTITPDGRRIYIDTATGKEVSSPTASPATQPGPTGAAAPTLSGKAEPAPPFPGGRLQSQSPDGTQGWIDPTTGRTRFYRGGQEIGSAGTKAQGGNIYGTAPAAPYDPKGTAGPISGMTNLQVDAYRQQAKNALQQLGVLDYQPTNDELRSFFTSGFDAEAIANYYMTDPTMVARQPGLPYGLSREGYQQRVQQLQQAYRTSFGGAAMPEVPKAGATQGDIQGNLFGYALKQGIDPGTFGQTVERFRQARGRAPTQGEYASFTSEQAAATPTGGGPRVTGGPQPAQKQEYRPAIGGRK